MSGLVDILILVAIAAVTVTLGVGIYALVRGGEFGRTWSNKLMRLRVVLQASALALLALGAFIASRTGG